jgi:hypothetical protein
MAILDNIDNPSYPESWHRQTPKGYDPHSDNKKVINDGLALKVFNEEVCDNCSCKTTVTNEMIESQTSFEE